MHVSYSARTHTRAASAAREECCSPTLSRPIVSAVFRSTLIAFVLPQNVCLCSDVKNRKRVETERKITLCGRCVSASVCEFAPKKGAFSTSLCSRERREKRQIVFRRKGTRPGAARCCRAADKGECIRFRRRKTQLPAASLRSALPLFPSPVESPLFTASIC